ncbi:hypothetical protein Cadr_000010671 [Camelus dromedarius]|uniref:Uncharacterized protein n=1 Tax=Camelus dromedarius TaxID=9838 RepID=A0A5N4DW47_CAMDR|nr:hypothetical protein Cadr_000010671 [Camelus dromedarius]
MWIHHASEVPSDVRSLRGQERAVWAGAATRLRCALPTSGRRAAAAPTCVVAGVPMRKAVGGACSTWVGGTGVEPLTSRGVRRKTSRLPELLKCWPAAKLPLIICDNKAGPPLGVRAGRITPL